jgi:assimilatory nitrate reductase catalytic subunit
MVLAGASPPDAGFINSNPHGSSGLAAFWNIAPERIPQNAAWLADYQAAVAKRVRALWIIATNPMVSFPNHDVLRQALETVEFLVVQDAFHPTPTSELADLILPAAMWGEKEGTYTNSERRVSKVNRAVAPPAEARPDFDIFLDLAERLGMRDDLFPGWQGPRDAFEEWKRVSWASCYSAMTHEQIEAEGGAMGCEVSTPMAVRHARRTRRSRPIEGVPISRDAIIRSS